MIESPYLDTDACVERLWAEYETHKRLIVAFDFDDTVYDFHKRNYGFGYVLDLLRRAKAAGCYLALFTASSPKRFPEMLAYLESHGVVVDSANENPIPLPFGNNGKIYYNILLDDKAGLGQAVQTLEIFLARCTSKSLANRIEFENRIRMGDYLDLDELLQLVGDPEPFRTILQEHKEKIFSAPGSSHNHQAWEGGYVHHIVECMNIACQMFWCLDDLRPLPFILSDALVVMFLHDLEKPWKHDVAMKSKSERREFRNRMIVDYGIRLSDSQQNALQYVEGVPDSEYTPGTRTMGELAAFCHMVDIASARLWHDKGQEGEW